MNLHRPNANEALQTKNRSRDVAPQSGICSRCLDGCKGNCDMFRATFRGRELLYPEPFGSVTAGAGLIAASAGDVKAHATRVYPPRPGASHPSRRRNSS